MSHDQALARPLRIGIVGCGKIADAHVEEIRHCESTDLVAVCDTEPILAEQLAERYSIGKRYTGLSQMLSCEHLDVVHITTPPQSHLSITEAVVCAGAHIVIEKPVALNGTDTDRTLSLQRIMERS